MNPVLAWLLQHPRDQWQDPQTRADYNLRFGTSVTDRDWNVGLARAYQSERVAGRLESEHGNTRVENLLRGVFALQEFLTVPFQLTYQVPTGAVISRTIYVTAHRSDRISVLQRKAEETAEAIIDESDGTQQSLVMNLGAYTWGG